MSVEHTDLSVARSEVRGWIVLTLHGELDLHTAPVLQEELDAAIAAGRKVAVELTDVPFMDSSSLGVLVVGLKRMRERDGALALVGISGSPQKVLSITGMDQLIPGYPTVDDLPQDP